MRHASRAVWVGGISLMLLGSTVQADDVFDGSVEIINEGRIPIVAVIDGDSSERGRFVISKM